MNESISKNGKKRKNSLFKGVFREIFICSTKELAPFGTVFVLKPENYEKQRLGTLFGVIEIADISQESSYVANLLASVMKKEYYLKLERSPDEAFESALRKANLALAELARHGSVSWTGKINFVGGVLEKNNLHFSQLGKTHALLIRQGQIADIGKEAESEKEITESHPLKTFSDISSGKIEKGDKLILTTGDLMDIFSLAELRQNAATFSRGEFPDLLEAALKTNVDLSGTVIIDLMDPDDEEFLGNNLEEAAENPILDKAKAMEEIIRSKKPYEAETRDRQLISPIDSDANQQPKEGHLYIKESEDKPNKNDKWKKTKLFAKNFFEKTIRLFSSLKNRILSAFGKINFTKIFSRESKEGKLVSKKSFQQFAMKEDSSFLSKISLAFRKIVLLVRNSFIKIKQRISAFSGKGLIFSSLALVVILVIIFFGLSKIFGEKKPAPVAAPPPSAAAPQAALPTDPQVKTIENIEEIATLPSESQGAALMGDNLFVMSKEKSIFRIDPATKQVSEIKSNLSSGNFKLLASMPNLNTLFILTEDKKMISLTPINNNFQENNISFPSGFNPVGLKAYLTYVYFLDPESNQIYRFPRAEGGFGERQDWLRSGADVTKTIGFSINEDLFAASPDDITAYLQGKIDKNVKFEKPQTPLFVEKIFTEPDLENIYVLDNKNHRIVQFGKDGKIINQFWNKSISKIDNFIVNEKNNAIFLLSGNNLSTFSY